MPLVNTDFIAAKGDFFNKIIVNITDYGSTETQNAPTQNLDAQGGISPGTTDNTGGRFGWIAFGQASDSSAVFERAQPINYAGQVYVPIHLTEPNAIRVWLRLGVKADVNASKLSWWIPVLQQVVNQLVQLKLKSLGNKAPGTAVAPVPNP